MSSENLHQSKPTRHATTRSLGCNLEAGRRSGASHTSNIKNNYSSNTSVNRNFCLRFAMKNHQRKNTNKRKNNASSFILGCRDAIVSLPNNTKKQSCIFSHQLPGEVWSVKGKKLIILEIPYYYRAEGGRTGLENKQGIESRASHELH